MACVQNGPIAYFLWEIVHRILRYYEPQGQEFLKSLGLSYWCVQWEQQLFYDVRGVLVLGRPVIGVYNDNCATNQTTKVNGWVGGWVLAAGMTMYANAAPPSIYRILLMASHNPLNDLVDWLHVFRHHALLG